jgi:hypothetical protein
MALMTRPEDISPDTPTENTNVVALEEDGNVEEENIEFSGLVAHVRERYERSKTRRESDEDRWLMAYRNYRGIYGPEVQFTDTEKSKAFIKITKTKVLAAYAQVTDVLLLAASFLLVSRHLGIPKGLLSLCTLRHRHKLAQMVNHLYVLLVLARSYWKRQVHIKTD